MRAATKYVMDDGFTALSPLLAPLPGPDDMALAQLARHAEQARGAYAANTERALRADVATFTGWCASAGLAALPAAPDTLARYVDDLAGRRAPATIRRAVSSVATFHRAAGLPSPAASQAVVLALKRLHRAHGRTQAQASPARPRTAGHAQGGLRRMEETELCSSCDMLDRIQRSFEQCGGLRMRYSCYR